MSEDNFRSISLLCPTCAGSQFEFDRHIEEATRVYKCVGCDGTFDHQHIMDANASRIKSEIADFGKEIVGDAVNNLRKELSKSKFIKIK